MRDSSHNASDLTEGRGPGSFCIPRAALNALVEAHANAYEVCAYLVLARFTDASGQFSTASISAVNRYTGANKVRNGPVDRAIQRLKTIHARTRRIVPDGKSGRAAAEVKRVEDLGPILFDRAGWMSTNVHPLPDGPTDRAEVLFVLPDFGEPLSERIWFGGSLVKGAGNFIQPLKELKNAGDVASRLLLLMYLAQDMETWGGVCPVGYDLGPWIYYRPVAKDAKLPGQGKLIRAKRDASILSAKCFARLFPQPSKGTPQKQEVECDAQVWNALDALQSAGLIYEVVMVLNRTAEKATFDSGEEYGDIPRDAEPLYELDCRSVHGFKPEGEEGVGTATAKTAGELGYPVTLEGGRFDGTYAAIVRAGYPAMIAGIYRLRFRVANPRNAGVKGAWARIHKNNREAFELLQNVRASNGLPLLPALEGQRRDSKNKGAADVEVEQPCSRNDAYESNRTS